MNYFQRYITCPDCGDPNVPCDTPSQRCDLCSTVCHWRRQQEHKRLQLSDDPTIPPLVERNLMASLHLQHAQHLRGATENRTCGTCTQSSGNDYHCVYCRNHRQNPNTQPWRPRHSTASAVLQNHESEAFRGLSRELPKKARLFDLSGTADRELACVICMEDIPAEVARVYYCDCQALICSSCETKPEVKRLEKCPNCRKDYR